MQIQKKDGRLEEFDRNKLKQSISAAGANENEAESITAQVEAWAPSMAINNAVHSQVIRAKVIELLKTANPAAAKTYEEYRKGSTKK